MTDQAHYEQVLRQERRRLSTVNLLLKARQLASKVGTVVGIHLDDSKTVDLQDEAAHLRYGIEEHTDCLRRVHEHGSLRGGTLVVLLDD